MPGTTPRSKTKIEVGRAGRLRIASSTMVSRYPRSHSAFKCCKIFLSHQSNFFCHFPQIEKRPFTEKVHSGHVWDGCMSLHFQDLDETVKANHFPGIQELGNKKKLFKVSFAFEGSRLTCCLLFSSELLLHAQETWARRLEIHGGYIHAAIRG